MTTRRLRQEAQRERRRNEPSRVDLIYRLDNANERIAELEEALRTYKKYLEGEIVRYLSSLPCGEPTAIEAAKLEAMQKALKEIEEHLNTTS